MDEPLKNKKFIYDEEFKEFVRDKLEDGLSYTILRDECFIEPDLVSAVKWLMRQIELGDGSEMTMCKENVLKKIEQAFPDLQLKQKPTS